MKSDVVIVTKKDYNAWLDVGNLFAKSICDRNEVLRQFNQLSYYDRIIIKKEFNVCDKIRKNKMPYANQEDLIISIMVDAHIIATEYKIDPLTAILCIKPICKPNEKILLRG